MRFFNSSPDNCRDFRLARHLSSQFSRPSLIYVPVNKGLFDISIFFLHFLQPEHSFHGFLVSLQNLCYLVGVKIRMESARHTAIMPIGPQIFILFAGCLQKSCAALRLRPGLFTHDSCRFFLQLTGTVRYLGVMN
jgi:hypothetical protein